jgi:hypothetical protein
MENGMTILEVAVALTLPGLAFLAFASDRWRRWRARWRSWRRRRGVTPCSAPGIE